MEMLSNKFDPGTSIYLACNSQMFQDHAVFFGHHFRPSQAAEQYDMYQPVRPSEGIAGHVCEISLWCS